MISREFIESPMPQGRNEALAYRLTSTPWAVSPTSPAVAIYSHDPDTDTYTDVSSTKLVGSPSISGDVITTPLVYALTPGTKYRVEVRFTVSGNTFEPFGWIHAER